MQNKTLSNKIRANNGLHNFVAAEINTLEIQTNDAVIDIGCGTGAFLELLDNNGFNNLHGVDILPPARNPFGASMHALDLDVEALPFPDSYAKVVTLIEVIEHAENPGRLLREIARVLQTDGYLLLTTPNVHSLECRLRFLLSNSLKQFDSKGDPTHITPVFLFPFSLLLKRAGLRTESMVSLPLDGTSPTSRLALRAVATVLRYIGFPSGCKGDNLYLKIARTDLSKNNIEKVELVTSHYK